MNPGVGSFQSAKVRTGTFLRSGVGVLRLRRLPPTERISRSMRSIVDALIAISFGLDGLGELQVAVALERWHEHGQERPESLSAHAVRCLPKYDERLANGLIVEARPTAATSVVVRARRSVQD